MNFLAHAYLSFGHPDILVGNMVSDFVKGSAQFSFSGKIPNGIRLHRLIDSFTDTHPATREAAAIFHADYRLYSGAIVDVLYDHFLATDPTVFDDESLRDFSRNVYEQIDRYILELPARFVQAFAYMRAQDWLYNYSHRTGVERSLAGLVRRAAYLTESRTAYNLFEAHYVHLQSCYRAFFPDVKQFAKQHFEAIE